MEPSSCIYWLEQTEADVPQDDDWLTCREKQQVLKFAIPKRRREWRLGRWTIKNAVSALGTLLGSRCAVNHVEVTVADSGAPQISASNIACAISVSHRAGTAMAAVAPSTIAVGCDLELVEPRSDCFVADYFTAEEQLFISNTSNDAQRAAKANLLWSAKESVLKAMQLGLRADPRDVCIACEDDLLRSSAVVNRHWLSYSIRAPLKIPLHGWWRCDGRFVRTLAGATSGPPVCLNVHTGQHDDGI